MKLTEYYINKARKLSQEMYIRTSWLEIVEDNERRDGFQIETCFGSTTKEIEKSIPAFKDLKALDTKKRNKPINVLSLIGYLASTYTVRELIFNNKWGIVVATPKKWNFPEKIVLNTIKDIVMEGIKTLSPKDRYTALMYMDSSPRDSICGRIWDSFPSVTLDPIKNKTLGRVGVWGKTISKIEDDDNEEKIIVPKEHIEFWRDIYKKRKEVLYGKTVVVE